LINEDIVTEDGSKTSRNVNVCTMYVKYKYKVYISHTEIT